MADKGRVQSGAAQATLPWVNVSAKQKNSISGPTFLFAIKVMKARNRLVE